MRMKQLTLCGCVLKLQGKEQDYDVSALFDPG